MITRLGLSGTPRGLYGSFAGKTPDTGLTLLNFMRGFCRGFGVGMNRG